MAIQVNKVSPSGATGNFFALTSFSVQCGNSNCTVTANYDLWVSSSSFANGDVSLQCPKQFICQISVPFLNGMDPWTFLDAAFLTWAQLPNGNSTNDPDFAGAALVAYSNIGSNLTGSSIANNNLGTVASSAQGN